MSVSSVASGSALWFDTNAMTSPFGDQRGLASS
jgi:hypothetical protein